LPPALGRKDDVRDASGSTRAGCAVCASEPAPFRHPTAVICPSASFSLP
jgi:hypothetical protein